MFRPAFNIAKIAFKDKDKEQSRVIQRKDKTIQSYEEAAKKILEVLPEATRDCKRGQIVISTEINLIPNMNEQQMKVSLSKLHRYAGDLKLYFNAVDYFRIYDDKYPGLYPKLKEMYDSFESSIEEYRIAYEKRLKELDK